MDRQNEQLVAAFAAALSEGREQSRLTQEELAARADVSARFISLLETGRRQPSLSALHALSLGLGVRMQDLIARVEHYYEDESLGEHAKIDGQD
ncbi:helix-turn-helix domain-containing protein [Roseovarius sp. D0-M9]|uniref:helix-turn-helix domain-containing protein n=1 Tax=Roseovarius sp. D0-M9 TaxID=3127117 RepID=UPI0030102F6B